MSDVRLDLEALADRGKILFSDRVERDLEQTFGGKVNGGHSKLIEDRRPTRR